MNLPEPLTSFAPLAPDVEQQNAPGMTLPVRMPQTAKAQPQAQPDIQASYLASSEMPTTSGTSTAVFYPEESAMPAEDLAQTRLAEIEAEFQARMHAQDEKIALLIDDRERLLEELNESRHRLAAIADSETALANTIVLTEQHRVQVEQELEQSRAIAQSEVQRLQFAAQQEAEAVLLEARQTAQEVKTSGAAYLSQAEDARQNALDDAAAIRQTAQEESEAMLAEVRRQVEAFAFNHHEQSEIEAEQTRAKARKDAELMVSDAKQHAEETQQNTLQLYKSHEEQLRTLGAECNEIVLRIRRALETQKPNATHAAPMGSSRTTSNDKLTAGWMPGSDWRNAS